MQTIELTTKIAAPMERCFLLSLSIDLHRDSAAGTAEQVIGGVSHGIIGPGESVTFRGRHFGLWLTHTSRITAYEPCSYFQDTMTRGMFRSFVHDHTFTPDQPDGTVMRDVLRFEAPLRPIGLLAERLVLCEYLRKFLSKRNASIKAAAESSGIAQKYLPEASAGR